MKISKRQLRQIIKEELLRLDERVTMEQMQATTRAERAFMDYLGEYLSGGGIVQTYDSTQEELYTHLIDKSTEIWEENGLSATDANSVPGRIKKAYQDGVDVDFRRIVRDIQDRQQRIQDR